MNETIENFKPLIKNSPKIAVIFFGGEVVNNYKTEAPTDPRWNRILSDSLFELMKLGKLDPYWLVRKNAPSKQNYTAPLFVCNVFNKLSTIANTIVRHPEEEICKDYVDCLKKAMKKSFCKDYDGVVKYVSSQISKIFEKANEYYQRLYVLEDKKHEYDAAKKYALMTAAFVEECEIEFYLKHPFDHVKVFESKYSEDQLGELKELLGERSDEIICGNNFTKQETKSETESVGCQAVSWLNGIKKVVEDHEKKYKKNSEISTIVQEKSEVDAPVETAVKKDVQSQNNESCEECVSTELKTDSKESSKPKKVSKPKENSENIGVDSSSKRIFQNNYHVSGTDCDCEEKVDELKTDDVKSEELTETNYNCDDSYWSLKRYDFEPYNSNINTSFSKILFPRGKQNYI